MSVAELLPQLKELSQDDKRCVMDYLRRELEQIVEIEWKDEYEIPAPDSNYGAAEALTQLLEEHRAVHAEG